MSFQQFVHPKSSANGIGRRKAEREGGTKPDNRLSSGKSNSSKLVHAESRAGGYGGPSRDRLVYCSTHLIGHNVEVQVKNGSIYSGIFHAANMDKDIGIILKMVHMIKDGSVQVHKANNESLSKPITKTMVIPAKELVQVMAKDFSITGDRLSNELQSEKQREIFIDSIISQARHGDTERELKPWVPEEDDPQCADLENVFDGPSRGWDQFAVNKTLFGVQSTFNEELYTTKLEKGPQMRELEKEAIRIAREIEGEETQDLHLAEERGIHFPESFDIDEETRFSSVYRGRVVDDSGYEEEEDIVVDSWNTETFGSAPGSVIKAPYSGITDETDTDGTQASARSSSVDGPETSQSSTGADISRSGAHDHANWLSSELTCKSVLASEDDSRMPERLSNQQRPHSDIEDAVKLQPSKDIGISKADDSSSSSNVKNSDAYNEDIPLKATALAPSSNSLKNNAKLHSRGDSLEAPAAAKIVETRRADSHGRPGSATSSTSDCLGAASASTGAGLTPSSSVGSLSSEKSSLNPHAKEFKLNPNAKSFVPSQAPVRPPSPVLADSSYYYSPNVSGVPHMPGMPVGIGPYVGHQPLMFNAQVAPLQAPQAYMHPNGPPYGQHMIVANPRQFPYMPSFPPDMPYKGRDY